MNKVLVFLFIFFAISACKRRPVAKTEEPVDPAARLEVHEIDFQYFTSKAKVDYKQDGNGMSFTATIRMQKDSIIWISASPGLGIEVVRAMITPDSVKIIDRINNRYSATSIAYLKETFNIDLSFANLQNILLGNLIVPRKRGDQLAEDPELNCAILSQQNENLQVANYVSREKKKVIKLKMSDLSTGNNLEVDYDDFEGLSGHLFPTENKIRANVLKEGKPSNLSIIINHNKAEISQEPLNFSFNVPGKFEKR